VKGVVAFMWRSPPYRGSLDEGKLAIEEKRIAAALV
jgi:hypothetical protein